MASHVVPHILDRDAELEAIDDAIDATCHGEGGALVIEGPAGIGKTTLLDCARDRAALAGLSILGARAGELEIDYAWGVVQQLFEPALRDSATRRELLRGAARLAAPAIGLGRRPAAEAREDPFAVVHGLYWLTSALADRSPLLLAVDDLHWSDAPTLRFVDHLLRRLRDLAVLVVCTTRTAPTGRPIETDRLLGAVLSGATLLRPGSLGPEACATILREHLGREPSARFQMACSALSGGNPFLLCALAETLATDQVEGRDTDVPHLSRLTPRSISQNVLLRLGRLPASALAAARAVAVLGSSATAERVAALSGLEGVETSEALGLLVRERMLQGETLLAFVHPLVRAAVYEELPAPIRRHWHERAAASLASVGAAPEEVAAQLLVSGASGDQRLVSTLRRAARAASERGAPDVAQTYLDRALLEPPRGAALTGVLFELGSLEMELNPQRAVELLKRALGEPAEAEGQAGGTASGAPGGADDGPRRGDVQLALGYALGLAGRFREAVEVLQATLAGLGDPWASETWPVRVALLNLARWDLATRPLGATLLAELEERAEAGGHLDPGLRANMAIELCAAARQQQLAVAHARAALEGVPELMAAAAALPEVVSVLIAADVVDEARGALERWSATAELRGWRHCAAIAASVASMEALRRGALSRAASWAEQSLEGGGDSWLAPIATGFLVLALVERGDLAAAGEALDQRCLWGELPATWPYSVTRHARARLLAARGDAEPALRELEAVGELAERWGIVNPALMSWRSTTASVLAGFGRRREARVLCLDELSLARQWGAPTAIGVAMRAGALLEDGPARLARLRDSAAVLEASPNRLERARTAVELGVALRHRGARLEARDRLGTGLHLAHECGALPLAERARKELLVAGGRPRRTARWGRYALTPSELRVAELAAEGRTNRQIAEAVFVGRRTVEIHLSSAYGKLGISSRRELGPALGTEAPAPAAQDEPAAPPAGRRTRRPSPAGRPSITAATTDSPPRPRPSEATAVQPNAP